MGAWNILKQFGVWTTVLSWQEPVGYRIRLKRDFFLRLITALAIGGAASGALLLVIAGNANPPPVLVSF